MSDPDQRRSPSEPENSESKTKNSKSKSVSSDTDTKTDDETKQGPSRPVSKTAQPSLTPTESLSARSKSSKENAGSSTGGSNAPESNPEEDEDEESPPASSRHLDRPGDDMMIHTVSKRSLSSITHVCYDRMSKPRASVGFALVSPVECDTFLRVCHNFGYDSNRRSNIHSLDEDHVLIISGSYLRILKVSTKEDTFVRCTGEGSFSCVAVHPEGTCFAAGESGTHPDIVVFTHPQHELYKVLSHGTQRQYMAVKFDPYQASMLVSQGAAPDYNLTIWDWEKEVPLLRSRSFSQDVYNVTFNSDLEGFLVSSGNNHIRFWCMALTFTGLKLQGQTGRFGNREYSSIEDCIQFADGKVISSSEEGNLLLWDEATLKAEFTNKEQHGCHKGKINQMFMHDGEIMTLGEDGCIRTWETEKLLFVDPEQDGDLYDIKPIEEIWISRDSSLVFMSPQMCQDPDDQREMWYIQDRSGRVWTIDLSLANANINHAKMIMRHHGGPIVACVISPNSYLAATGGQDGFIRVFECILRCEVLAMPFRSPVSSLIWLPLQSDSMAGSIIAGFDEGVIRKIAFCRNNKSSQSAAVVLDGKLSQVFKAHKSRVSSLAISSDGQLLASGAEDATIFFFWLRHGNFDPIGWVNQIAGVRQLLWTPSFYSYRALLVVLEEGIVTQIDVENPTSLQTTQNYEITNLNMKLFKFVSTKSHHEHVLEIARLQRELEDLESSSSHEMDMNIGLQEKPDVKQRLPSAMEEAGHDPNSKAAVTGPKRKSVKIEIPSVALDPTSGKKDPTSAQIESTSVTMEPVIAELESSSVKLKTKTVKIESNTVVLAPARTRKESESYRKESASKWKEGVKKYGTLRRSTVGLVKESAKAIERLKTQRKLREETEDWVQFIPPTPSPITQAAYSINEDEFWLTLGGYDNGYVYLCKFRDKSYHEGDALQTFDTAPLKMVPIADCPKGAVVTVLNVDYTTMEVLMGFDNGYVRLVDVSASRGLTDLSNYWELNLHDYVDGSLTALALGFDASFVLTCGMDGNLFLMSRNKQLELLTPFSCRFPSSFDHHPTCKDIGEDALWFADEVEQKKQQESIMLAEGFKNKTKRVLRDIQMQMKRLMAHNDQIPKKLRLSRQELLVNTDLYNTCKLTQEQKMKELHHSMRWESVKYSLLMKKAVENIMQNEPAPSPVVVKAFSQGYLVRSYRIPAAAVRVRQEPQPQIEEEKEENPADDTMEEGTEDTEQASGLNLAWEMKQTANMVKKGFEDALLAGSIARTLQSTLKKAAKSAEKRAARKKMWDALFEEKKKIDVDNPEELAAIEVAKGTLGDRKLKTCMSNAVNMMQTHTLGIALSVLYSLDEEIRSKMKEFNNQVEKLREEKLVIIKLARAIDVHISKPLDYGKRNLLCFAKEEVPEELCACDETFLMSMRGPPVAHPEPKLQVKPSGVKVPRKLSLTHAPSIVPSIIPSHSVVQESMDTLNIQKEPRPKQHYFKGRRGDYPEVVSFFLSQRDDPPVTRGKIEQAPRSPLLKEVEYFNQMEKEHQEKRNTQYFRCLMDQFDLKVRRMQKEQSELDIYLQKASIMCNELLEEDQLDKEMGEEEYQLKKAKYTGAHELEKNQKITNNLKQQLTQKQTKLDELLHQVTELWEIFNTACKEKDSNASNMRYWTMLFKRKEKKSMEKQPVRDGDLDSSDGESSDSSSLSFDSPSGSEQSFIYDFEFCPPNLDRELFDTVVALQKERRALDEKIIQRKQVVVELNKELELKIKDSEAYKKTYLQAQDRLLKFYEEKTTKLNEMCHVVVLNISQLLTDVDPSALIMDLRTLKRLHFRVQEIKRDIRYQGRVMKTLNKKYHFYSHTNDLMKAKIFDLDRKCNHEMIKKFGRVVDLVKLELVTINPKAELVRCRLMADKQQQVNEVHVLKRELDDLQEQLVELVDVHTDYMTLVSDYRKTASCLTRSLDKHIREQDISLLPLDMPLTKIARSTRYLRHLVEEQAKTIQIYWHQIHHLTHFPNADKPPKSSRLSFSPSDSGDSVLRYSAKSGSSPNESSISWTTSFGRSASSRLKVSRGSTTRQIRIAGDLPGLDDRHPSEFAHGLATNLKRRRKSICAEKAKLRCENRSQTVDRILSTERLEKDGALGPRKSIILPKGLGSLFNFNGPLSSRINVAHRLPTDTELNSDKKKAVKKYSPS